MINDGINNVPDKTIAVFIDDANNNVNFKDIKKIVKKPEKKRDWFPVNAYYCLPLLIANQYGFIITADFGFNAIWNGGNDADDIIISPIYNKDNDDNLLPGVLNHFGNGIITLNTPFVFRTPPGVNLMTINPPNHILENITVLSGSVETDNIRMPFTFNLKIHQPNVLMSFPKGTPLAAIIPIPRYFCDSFNLVNAEDIFDSNIVTEEIQAFSDHNIKRASIERELPLNQQMDRHYFSGTDIYGNKFKDHQTGKHDK